MKSTELLDKAKTGGMVKIRIPDSNGNGIIEVLSSKKLILRTMMEKFYGKVNAAR